MYSAPQLQNQDVFSAIRKAGADHLRMNGVPQQLWPAILGELDRESSIIQSDLEYRKDANGSAPYSAVQQLVDSRLQLIVPRVMNSMAQPQYPQPYQQPYQQPYGGYPQQPAFGMPVQQPQQFYGGPPQQRPQQVVYNHFGQPVLVPGISMQPMYQPQQMYPSIHSAEQGPHQPSNIQHNSIAAKYINDAHRSNMGGGGYYQNQGPPQNMPMSSDPYRQQQQVQQQPATMHQHAQEAGMRKLFTPLSTVQNAPQAQTVQPQVPQQDQSVNPEPKTNLHGQPVTYKKVNFAPQVIKEITAATGTAERITLAKEAKIFDKDIDPDVVDVETVEGNSGDHIFHAGRGTYHYPCVSAKDLYGTISRSLPNTFPLKKPYFIDMTYPQLEAKYLRKKLTETDEEKLKEIFNQLAIIGQDVQNGAQSVDDAIPQVKLALYPEGFDRRIGEYLERFILRELTKKLKFGLSCNSRPAEFIKFEDISILVNMYNFDKEEGAGLPDHLKKKFNCYPNRTKQNIEAAIISVLGELVVSSGKWESLPKKDDYSAFAYLKHPSVGARCKDAPIEFLTSEEDIATVKESLKDYLFHTTTRHVMITNAKESGLDHAYMGCIINFREKYQHQLIQHALENGVKGNTMDYLIVDEFGEFKEMYTLGINLDNAILCLKHTTW